MFKKIKHWIAIVAASLGIYQVQRPATMETSTPPVLAEVRPTPQPTATPVAVATPVPVDPVQINKAPKMILEKITGASVEETFMIKSAIDDANTIMASPCFAAKVFDSQFTETNGLNNKQIWNLLSSKPIKVSAEMYDGSWRENYVWKTMGYDIGDGVVYMNRYFAKGRITVASLATHEAEGHGQGFHHYDNHYSSVPYRLNDFIESCAEAIGL